LMESPVCQETLESLDPQVTRHILEDWELRWQQALVMRNQQDRWPCCQGPGEKLVQEDLLGRMASLVTLDHKDPLGMLVILVRWGLLGHGDLRALQGSREKMVKRENQEMQENRDFLAQRELEDFLGHLDLRD